MKAGVFKECTFSYVVKIIRKHPFLFSMFMFHLAKFRLYGDFIPRGGKIMSDPYVDN